ncbi:response regulator transcription factor [soil metagenome]|nr:response regulator transcription factor [Acidobacteriota bacterium]
MATAVHPIRVLLADDHETVRQGLKLLVDGQRDMTVVAEAADGHAAVRWAQELEPDVVVMDVSMPGMNGLRATRAIKQARPHVAVISLTRHGDDAYLQEMLRAGVSGYVLKQSPSTELLDAIRAVAEGRQHLDVNLPHTGSGFPVRGSDKTGDGRPAITERETEVLRLLAWGHSNKEIAARLDVSVKTVEVHKANASRKLSLRGRIDIVRYALLQGWLQDG